MCYHKAFISEIEELSKYFPDLKRLKLKQGEMRFTPSAHIPAYAHAEHPIIYREREQHDIAMQLMEWGVIPFYVKDEAQYAKQRNSMVNIRSERILEDHKSYWYKIRDRRCLIPVSGFYEYRGIKGWKNKVPYYICLKDQPIFFLPALYSVAELPDPETGEAIKRFTYAMITRTANSLLHKIHNAGDNPYRMPLMLPKEVSEQWINKELLEKDYKEILSYSMPVQNIDYHPVYSLQARNGRPDGQAADAPYQWEKLPALGEAEPLP